MTFPFANAALNMTLKTGWLSLLLCGIFYGAFAQVPPDEHPHHHAAPESSVAKKAPEKITIPDAMLVDQNGKQVHFYNDLVKDKVVAVNFIFTTCTTICPPLGATFAKVQNLLGARQNVQLISISVDPTTDTPERLQEWRAKFSAQPGWTLLTGSKPEVDKLLRALGGFTARKEDHTPTLLIGNGSTGLWTRTYGLAKPTEIVKIIDEMSQNQQPFRRRSASLLRAK